MGGGAWGALNTVEDSSDAYRAKPAGAPPLMQGKDRRVQFVQWHNSPTDWNVLALPSDPADRC